MLFDVSISKNYNLTNNIKKLIEDDNCSENIKNIYYEKLDVIHNNYETTFRWTPEHFRHLSDILVSYFGTNVPEISKEPIIYINKLFKFNKTEEKNYENITIDVSSPQANTSTAIWGMLKQLELLKKEFPKVISLELESNHNSLIKLYVDVENNKISINFFKQIGFVFGFKNFIEAFLLWISKNIKEKEKENFKNIIDIPDFKKLLFTLEVDNIDLIRNEVTLTTLYGNMNLERLLKEALDEKEDKLNQLIRQINDLNNEYELKILKLTNYKNSFKQMYEQTHKTINYHINKTKYLHCCPNIDNMGDYMSINIKTNILPVINLNNIATYIKTYGNNHNEKELEMLEKIKNEEAFLAVAPEEVCIEYYINSRGIRNRRFRVMQTEIPMSRNEHTLIGGGEGCLGSYATLFNEAARELDVNKTIINVINYLQSVSSLDAAGKHSFNNMMVLDEFGEKIIYARDKSLIGKTREEVSKEIWQKLGF